MILSKFLGRLTLQALTSGLNDAKNYANFIPVLIPYINLPCTCQTNQSWTLKTLFF
jgi:hypothetical protein